MRTMAGIGTGSVVAAIVIATTLASCTGRSRQVAQSAPVAGQVIAVNAYLWRASLDVLQFMPLSSADPYGGIILTDWYIPPDAPDERFKASVYILDRRLRADAISVTVFREVRTSTGWRTARVSEDTAYAIEGAILEKARRIYLSRG